MKAWFALFVLFSGNTLWADTFTYTDLQNLIQQNKTTSIETLLPLLPEDFRSGYTLMKTSGSLQEASPANPRVIMFGQDASLTCAFNGDETQKGFNRFECFQFQKDQRSFDFREITFPTPASAEKKVIFSRTGKSSDGTTSCLSCHGADPRPNWDAYSFWSGAYGASDDDVSGDTSYPGFVAIRSTHPRYKWLIQGTDPTDPYSSFAIEHRPNLRFSDFVGRMNAFRTSRILENAVPDWQSLAFALSTLSCTLSSDQQAQVTKSGLPFNTDSNPLLIFQKLNIAPNDWSTEISLTAQPSPIYDHQSGFGFLALDTAMAIVANKANAGDRVFQTALTQLTNTVPAQKDGTYVDFYRVLFGILPDPDFFGANFTQNEGLFCPELSQLFIQEYLASKR